MLLALCAASFLAQEAPPRVLPEGTAAERTAAALHGGIEAHEVAMSSWRAAESWTRWSADLAAARAPGQAEPEHEARLALFALEQMRWEDAWRHFARTSAEPAIVAGLLPRFLPGVDAGAPLAKDGFAGALADGVVLRPALPPAKGDAPPGRIERREMKLARLSVGKATLSLRVALEYDGVVVELAHVAGEPCALSVVLPCEAGYVFANEYVDWYAQETHGAPLGVTLKPGEEAHTLYGRLDLRPIRGPERVPERLPELVKRQGLVLELGPDDPDRQLLDAIAASWKAPPLELGCALWVRGKGAPPAGLRIDLVDPAARAPRLAELCGMIEHFALGSH